MSGPFFMLTLSVLASLGVLVLRRLLCSHDTIEVTDSGALRCIYCGKVVEPC